MSEITYSTEGEEPDKKFKDPVNEQGVMSWNAQLEELERLAPPEHVRYLLRIPDPVRSTELSRILPNMSDAFLASLPTQHDAQGRELYQAEPLCGAIMDQYPEGLSTVVFNLCAHRRFSGQATLIEMLERFSALVKSKTDIERKGRFSHLSPTSRPIGLLNVEIARAEVPIDTIEITGRYYGALAQATELDRRHEPAILQDFCGLCSSVLSEAVTALRTVESSEGEEL